MRKQKWLKAAIKAFNGNYSWASAHVTDSKQFNHIRTQVCLIDAEWLFDTDSVMLLLFMAAEAGEI